MSFFTAFDSFFRKYGNYLLVLFFIISIVLLLIVLIAMPSATEKPQMSGDQIRELANKLYEWKLYPQAIEQYQYYLNFYSADAQEQANINYVIGNIYFDRMHDYEGALTHYAKVKYYFPESNLMPDINKKVVACLERLQRTMDAKQMLDESTSLDSGMVRKSLPGEVIAKVGDRRITQGDLDFEINQLPPYMQSQFTSLDGKKKFLQQYISTELLYETAKRAGLDKVKEVIEGAFQAKKQLMAQKYLEQEIAREMNIKPEDVELYYRANKDKYAEKDDKGKVIREKSLDEVQQQVAQDLVRDKQMKAYEALIQRLTQAQSVEIYDDKIK
ncbi:SurA N-terminal domain-containing protein [candidate division KSB1 bacterium]|nr:SurA N-terminal domain-containing protein [candidate division KSB1 bacterium]